MGVSDDFHQKLVEARRVLKQIPGVLGVGYGFKERAGKLTTEHSFRVYVEEKKPLSALAPDEVIPERVLGIPTDVLRIPEIQPIGCADKDTHSPLIGGITVTTLREPSGSTKVLIGTLGFFGTLNGKTPRDNVVALTNNHVLAYGGGDVGTEVFQPKFEVIQTPTLTEGKNKIGTIQTLGKRDHHSFQYKDENPVLGYWVDAALSTVDTCYSSWCKANCGVSFANSINGLAVGGKDTVEGTFGINHDNVPQGSPYPVFKVGATTGRTVGTVADSMGSGRDNETGAVIENIIIIENTGPNCEGGTRFADEGDSGSLVVNGDRQAVGLLFGANIAATPTRGFACHIDPVLDAVKMTLLSTSNAEAAGASSVILDAPSILGSRGEDVVRAETLRRRIVDCERGRRYRELVERHRHEVMELVNRRRAVTVTWHRLHGPDFLGHVIHASRHAGYSVPRELGGVARDAALAQLLEALAQHGSDALRHDVRTYTDEVRALLDGVDEIEQLAEKIDARFPERSVG